MQIEMRTRNLGQTKAHQGNKVTAISRHNNGNNKKNTQIKSQYTRRICNNITTRQSKSMVTELKSMSILEQQASSTSAGNEICPCNFWRRDLLMEDGELDLCLPSDLKGFSR